MADHPTPIDISTLVAVREVVARAFHDDPMIEWLFPHPDQRLDAAAVWLGLFVEAFAQGGHIDQLEEDGKVVAASAWRTALQDRPPFAPLPNLLGLITAFVGRERTQEILKGFAMLGAAHPTEPHAYLQLLAVTPDCQGRGLGRRVLQPCLDASDAAREGVYLETMTERNVKFYRSLGFEVTAEMELDGGGPRTWAMYRPPLRS